MKAVILNSGIGSRMGDLTAGRPKCLVPLSEEETILSRQIRMLLQEGIDDILITIGPFGNMIPDYLEEQFPGNKITYVRNDIYDSTNYIYSMYLADAQLREEILLLHGDIVLEKKSLEQVLKSGKADRVVVDSTVPLPEKDFKGRVDGGKIVEIGISLTGDEDLVFLLPVYGLSEKFMNIWMDEIGRFVERKETSVYAENAFNAVSDKLELMPEDIKGSFCMEVDTLEDLEKARELAK